MTTIVTRAGKGSSLTWTEGDANFTNLNNDKLEAGGALGTPVSGTLTNCTGLPAAGVSGTALVAAAIGTTVQAYDADLTTWAGVTPGTGVATALAVNVGSAGAAVINGGALGTPVSGTLTNCTGYPSKFVLVAPAVSTSGTAVTFTGIPAGTKRITVMGVGVSITGTNLIVIQIGDAGGFEVTGYVGGYSGGITPVASATGFGVQDSTAANAYNFKVTLDLENATTFTWVATGVTNDTAATQAPRFTHGVKLLSAELTQVRVACTGADTFDAGEISISYES